jgi:phosphoribosylamine--glycine ligase
VHIFHAGSAQLGAKLVTSGGRVLGVAAAGDSLEDALRLVYQSLAEIQFEGMYYRTDIGYRAVRIKSPH